MNDDPGGQSIAIGELAYGQRIQLPCRCTVTYVRGGVPFARVIFGGVSPLCEMHTQADITRAIQVGTLTAVWAAPDAVLKSQREDAVAGARWEIVDPDE